MDQVVQIEDRSIGGDNPTFIVAELSANHCQRFDIAIETIYGAKEAGAAKFEFRTNKKYKTMSPTTRRTTTNSRNT